MDAPPPAPRPAIVQDPIPYDARRKEASARADALNSADVVILCLPDDAAREAVALIANPNVKVRSLDQID